MNRVAEYLFAISLTLWVGGLWAIGMIAAPILFQHSGDANTAGNLAGSMFAVMAWVGVVAGVYAMVYLFMRDGPQTMKTAIFWIVTVMLLLTLAGHFGVTPILAKLRAEAFPRQVMESVVRNRFAAWHGVSSALYLIQCVLGVTVVSQLFVRR